VSIFQRSLTREFTAVGSSVVAVLVAIMVVQAFITQLKRAASGSIEPEAVIALLGFLLVAYLPVILALALFVSVLLTLSRSYRDSEMPVWFSSGLSITAWVNPVLRFGLPIVLVTAGLSLFLTPWALSQSSEYERILKSRDEISRLSPGTFIEARSTNQMYFIDKTADNSEYASNVFMHYNENGRVGVLVAEKGFSEIDAKGDKVLVLLNGRQYEGTPSALDFRVIDFQRMTKRIDVKEIAADTPRTKQLSTMALIKEPTADHIAELHWRIALPVAALILALMAIPLSFVNPRSGTSANLILAVLIFFLYYNLLNFFQAWTVSGTVPMWLGLLPVHVLMIAILVVLFSRQLFSFRFLVSSRR
jgi:lipopolysaccharide export system permease protein